MKMNLKLIFLFSVLAIAVTGVFSAFFYSSNIQHLYDNTRTSLESLSQKMQEEIEQYVKLMEVSLDELTSDTEFMDSFHNIYKEGSEGAAGTLQAAQTRMSQLLYQAPLSSAFYRVSVFTDEGFFLTSRFEKTDAFVSFSDEARETVASLDYLQDMKKRPNQRVLLGPHADPWTADSIELVFSIVRVAVWHGEIIGYMEVSAPLDDLAGIFLFLDQEGISTQAIFDDGTELFRMFQDDEVYPEMPAEEMVTYTSGTTADRWVIKRHSNALGLNIYVSQEIQALGSSRMDILKRSFLVMLPILVAAILLIILISSGLTRSIRRLSHKIQDLPTENFLSRSDLKDPTTVVSPSDKELYDLEQSFNKMLTSLRLSHANEVSLREGALNAKLKALQLQINPHFVYNTLNIISAKGLESGNEEITELCDQFAQMLRYSTDVRSSTATLKEELEHVQSYLFLCKSRFEDQLEFTIEVPKELEAIVVPKLTLQPVVENALKYGFKSGSYVRRIQIMGIAEKETLSLLIRDNGEGFDWETLNRLRRDFRLIERNELPEEPSAESHLGLINTYRRLYYYSHGRIWMELYNENGAVVNIIQDLSETPEIPEDTSAPARKG